MANEIIPFGKYKGQPDEAPSRANLDSVFELGQV